MPRLTKEQRHEAIRMLRALPVTSVARFFNVHKTTIHRLVQKVRNNGPVSDRQRSGRPRKTSDAEDRHIRTAHLRNRFKTSSETSRDWRGNNQISRFTVARRLHVHGINSRRPCKKKLLTPRHKVARLDFARRYVRWTMQQWMRVIFLTSCRIPSNRKMVARESGVARERGLPRDAS